MASRHRTCRPLPRRAAPQAASSPAQETIDGFHLVIEALKLNGIDTIFGLPGIPITDLTPDDPGARACA